MSADLLPDNATDLERELALASAPLDQIDPAIIETIWDAWRCPKHLLSWLAWSLSVDHWDDGWSEIVKRQAIADSPDYHRRKGTRATVEQLLALPGLPVEITEWFDRVPQGRRGTAIVHVAASLDAVNAYIRAIQPLMMTSKPKSRAIYIGAGERIPGTLLVGAGLLTEDLTTVEPFAYAGETLEGGLLIAAGLLTEDLTIVEHAA